MMDGKVAMMFFGSIFNCEWPPKVLRNLFACTKVIPNPEFKPFDVKSLRIERPVEDRDKSEAMAERTGSTPSSK